MIKLENIALAPSENGKYVVLEFTGPKNFSLIKLHLGMDTADVVQRLLVAATEIKEFTSE